MLDIFNGYKGFIIIGLVIFIFTIGFFLRSVYLNLQDEIENLENEKLILNSKLLIEKTNNITAKAIIDKQNKEIESKKVDYEKNIKDFEEWKNQPPETRYKEVIKYKEVKSNECEDIKNIINSIRSTSF
ncbi:MAG TPA: hypothetical protein VJY14_04775 [Aliarcobacter sp.]|nr:hypothetical protein [Aliarcobacter sp.]